MRRAVAAVAVQVALVVLCATGVLRVPVIVAMAPTVIVVGMMAVAILAALDALFDKVAAHSHHDNLEVFCAFSKLAFYLCDGGGDGGIGGRWPSEVPYALR